jgi:hypothetical protein
MRSGSGTGHTLLHGDLVRVAVAIDLDGGLGPLPREDAGVRRTFLAESADTTWENE